MDAGHASSPNQTPSASVEKYAYCLALLLFLIYGLLLAYVIIRNEPITSPVFAVVIRTFTALIAGLLAAALPGSVIVTAQMPVPMGGKLMIQAASGIAIAVLAYIYTPEVYPDTFPVKFNQPTLPQNTEASAELVPIPGDGISLADQRLVDQMQSWKAPLASSFAFNRNKVVVFRSKFTRAYEPFHARVRLKPDSEGKPFGSHWNDIFAMEPALAFLVHNPDVIDKQLRFEVLIDGNGKNPTNENTLLVEGVSSGQQLLLVLPFSARIGHEQEFSVEDVTNLVEVVNLDYQKQPTNNITQNTGA